AQARLVLQIAAAYGRDPSAAELLVLMGVHPDADAAAAALAQVQRHDDDPPRRLIGPLARVLGREVLKVGAVRRAARLLPGAGAVVAAFVDARGTERLAARAVRYYGSTGSA